MNDLLWGTNLSWPGLQYAEGKRQRGRNAISQNYPPEGLLLPLLLSSSFLGKSAKSVMQNIGREQCFQCEHPEGTLSLTRKYSESGKISGDRNPDIRD